MTQFLIGVTGLVVVVGILAIPTDVGHSSKENRKDNSKERK
ncbi:hypothetical protein [Companilactobacillus hulinensis]|nr:hypothetical protein [Companilactobacillus hulinensis]